MLSYKNRTVVITGGARGLGRSYAEMLGQRGAHIMLNDIHGAEAAAKELSADGIKCTADTSDISTREGAQTLAENSLALSGRIDALINNAGIGRFAPMTTLDLDEYELVRRVGLDATVYVTHAFWPSMIRQQFGRVIMTTSGTGLVGELKSSAFAVAKAGVYGLMRVLALEGADAGIKVNAIAPVAATAMSAEFTTVEVFADLQRKYSAELVARAVAVLAHESCPSTGTIVDAGGGRVGTAAFVTAPGLYDREADTDTLLTEWQRVTNFTDARALPSGNATAALVEEMSKKLGLK